MLQKILEMLWGSLAIRDNASSSVRGKAVHDRG
jgi:hypothetical protein